MQPLYHLADHIHFCETDSGVVFLDLKKRNYFALGPKEFEEVKGAASPWYTDNSATRVEPHTNGHKPSATIDTLVQKGILSRTPRSSLLDQKDLLVARTYYSSHSERHATTITPIQALVFFIYHLYVRLNLRRNRLDAMIGKLQKTRTRRPANFTPDNIFQRFVALFDRLRPWAYTAHNECLKDSLTLTHFLRWNGVPATLVLGIRTKPFAAHAWVQVGDCVVNDEAERVQLYRPILTTRTFQ